MDALIYTTQYLAEHPEYLARELEVTKRAMRIAEAGGRDER